MKVYSSEIFKFAHPQKLIPAKSLKINRPQNAKIFASEKCEVKGSVPLLEMFRGQEQKRTNAEL